MPHPAPIRLVCFRTWGSDHDSFAGPQAAPTSYYSLCWCCRFHRENKKQAARRRAALRKIDEESARLMFTPSRAMLKKGWRNTDDCEEQDQRVAAAAETHHMWAIDDPRHPRKVVTWAEIQAMGPKDKKNGAKGLRSRLKAFGITGLTSKPTALMRAALALRLGITVPQAPAPIAPAALVPVDWSNDADESDEEEEEIQEERARAMDESEDENSDLW